MSIDGYVERVKRDAPTDSLILELCGRDGGDGYSPAGQSTLWIIKPTWEPPVGSTIWGSASTVEVQSPEGEKHEYIRRGYSALVEISAFRGNLFWCGCGWTGDYMASMGKQEAACCPECGGRDYLVNPNREQAKD